MYLLILLLADVFLRLSGESHLRPLIVRELRES
jgi:hypothetical protein